MIAERVGVDGGALQRTSWLVAKVDSAAVRDGLLSTIHSAKGQEWKHRSDIERC